MSSKYSDWRYYNHSIISNLPPHKIPNLNLLYDKKKFSSRLWDGNKPLLISYSTKFDKVDNTNWWYVICDKPFYIENLNTKKRYEIKKARSNFNVSIVDPTIFVEELFEVYTEAQKSYPEKNRSKTSIDEFSKYLKRISMSNALFYIAAHVETNKIVGYCVTPRFEEYVDLQSQKAIPEYEKQGVNAALIDKVLEVNNPNLEKGNFYICDGSRNINHETHFQDYLEKKFGFRKAYCKLNIKYSRKIKWIVYILYPFRKIFLKFDDNKYIHLLNGLLKLENIRRKDKNE